jgi:mannosyltransferase OCH1-like enzyme
MARAYRDIVQSKQADDRAANIAMRAAKHASRRHEMPADIASAWHTSASGYRPALIQATTSQRIPRRIIQLGKDFQSVMSGRNADFVEQWWTLNPDHEYALFNDSHARRYVMARASSNETHAYLSLLRGAQRADLFRMIWMKYEGGVYADLDSKPLNPLSSVIPPMASAYTGQSWSFEFLAYEPRHPIIQDGLKQMTRRVLGYVEALKQDASKACLSVTGSNLSQKTCYEQSHACFGAHRCVVSTTGPLAYQAGIGDATHRL